MPTVAGQVIRLQLRANKDDWSGFFDRLEVWRGDAATGPFTELTAPQWVGARIPDIQGDPPPVPPAGDSVALSGKTLSLLVNEKVPIDITFTGSDPITYATAVTQINAGGQGLVSAFVSADGHVVLQTAAPGTETILRVVPTDAAALLGLPTTLPSAVAYGKTARSVLIADLDVYDFVDYHGDPTFFYRTRFSNSLNGDVSEFSPPFPGGGSAVLDPSLLILGVIDIIDLQGRPIQNREISISTKFTGVVAEGRAVMPRDQVALTDASGHAEFTLIRGMTITVAVAGSQIVRDVVVPSDPALTFFRLLDASVGSDDVFVVQKPQIDYAVRRSL